MAIIAAVIRWLAVTSRSSASIDYSKVGLKVGLEVHQQLDVAHKLFCSCPPRLFKEEPEASFLRRLRPTQSELGQVDPAAYFEFQKGLRISYEANKSTSCLVEMDEEPPHDLNREALEAALTFALMIDADPVDEVHVMRKVVIDGSNTTGFQRTCVVALGGEVEVSGKVVPIQQVCLEEDAARLMGKDGAIAFYRIDRLGVPLIEVTTAPVITSPKEAGEVALTVGRLLRATRKVKRGLGTIRQDLNISIRDGALIEIKGVQELELIPMVVEYEVRRQLSLIKLREELKARNVEERHIKDEFVDVTMAFVNTKYEALRKSIEEGKRVLAVKLLGFSGLLRRELMPNVSFGDEMADRARFWGRIDEIFNTDELPSEISNEEVELLSQVMKARDEDAIVLAVGLEEDAIDALKAVTERAREALRGVPEETRAANPNGTTRYMRPRPGAARMYPETDVPSIRIEEEYVKRLRSRLPMRPEQMLKLLMKEYGLNEKLARQVLDSEYCELFEGLVKETKAPPTLIATTLTETLKALQRDGIEVSRVSSEQLKEIFTMIGRGELAKEAIPDVVTWLSEHEGLTAKEAVESLGLIMLSEEELERIVKDIVRRNEGIIKQRGPKAAFGLLMGAIMREYRGRVRADVVSSLLKEELETFG